jgi:glutamate synthase (NADPH/NADH) small chain
VKPVWNGKSVERIFAENFAEIAPAMKPEEARLEAARCLYCYDAPCIQACPTHIDVPRFIKQIASQNLTGSAKTILEANPLGHSCARVCPVEVLCEGACVFLAWHKKPIQIARLQRHATDHYYSGKSRFKPGPDNGLPVAVVGAGPAGLSCAFYLRRLGHPVTMFESKSLGGGLNSFGIAEYKMTQSIALQEVRHIIDLGVNVRFRVTIGQDIPWKVLEEKFSAIFIGIGLGETRSLSIPGEGLEGVIDALTFIEHIKNRNLSALKVVDTAVVIGAGNTAIDAATQAKRLGTKRVFMAYRRSKEEMSAYDYEFELAKADEVEFLWNVAPRRILGEDSVEGVEFCKTESRSGRLTALQDSQFQIPCQQVIKAIGQTQCQDTPAGLRLNPNGSIWVNPKTLQSSDPRYYAGGDGINGGKEVVHASADGKRAAWNIHKTLAKVERPSPDQAYWVSTIA